ncbi:MAG: undecaprenyldiphospho-muramoylpentapeptide beta-N-acetylglucosaminyltransferase [Actinobacteria bacterium]|nr:MAG: undecaprenyldiphospho-muramoylpentapeptide beta-N-acetylglucosaminyltransferase [Actinomycetota bacterium]
MSTATAEAEAGATYALVTGGGTGGHVYPALAVANELVRRGHARETIRFVGARRGLEAQVVPAAGYAIDLLPGRGLQRRWSLRALVANVGALAGTIAALVRAFRIVRRRRPRVVLGVGGYASFACLLAARARRVPAVVHEQNAAPGLSNRIAVRLGARAAVSLPGTSLSGGVLTGNPVRVSVAQVERRPDPRRPLVAVVGGSLGARRLNDAALGLYERWRSRDDVAVCHVTGRRNHAECAARLDSIRRDDDRLDYSLVPYEENMAALYTRTAVAVCRAGAVTVAELAAAGIPAVLVPLPGAPADHQTRNAQSLAGAGAALLIPDDELDAACLAATLDELLHDDERREAMAAAAHRLARPDAAARVADLVEAVAR